MDPKSPFKKIVDYLENLGTQHTQIKSCYRWNKSELSGAFRTGVPLTAMLIDSVEIYPKNPNSRTYNAVNCAFTVLGKEGVSTIKMDSYTQQNEVLEHCAEVASEVVARLKYDSTIDARGSLKWLYGNFEVNDVHMFKVGPVFTEQLYGYRCEFIIKQKQSYIPDVTKWTDLPNP